MHCILSPLSSRCRFLLGLLATLFLSAGPRMAAGAHDSPEPRALNYRIGVATHFSHKTPWMHPWDAERHLPMIADLGVGWIRDEIVWREVEPTPGNYTLSEKSRRWIDLANSLGLKIIICFADRNLAHKDPFDPEAYARAAAWLARELDGKIHAIEILNEPFGYYAAEYNEGHRKGGTWYGREKDGSVSPWMARYVRLLNTAADAIKAANPRIPVIGLGNTAPENYQQIAMGISRNVDGITDHPYSFRAPPEIIGHRDTPDYRRRVGFAVADAEGSFASLVRMYREHLKKHNGPDQLWFTEFGHTTYLEGDPQKKFLYAPVTESAQAKYLLRRYMESLALEIAVSIQYAFLDDQISGGEFEAENGFGLIRNDDSPKPAYHAVRRLAHATRGFASGASVEIAVSPFSTRSEAPQPALNRILSYPFTDTQGRTVFAIWSAERPSDLSPRSAKITITVDPKSCTLEVLDLMTGQVSAPAFSQDQGQMILNQFAVPDYPVLLRLLPVAAPSS